MSTVIFDGGAEALEATLIDVLGPLFEAEFYPSAKRCGPDSVQSTVEIRGDHAVACVIECDRALAADLAAQLRLCRAGEAPDQEMLNDTVCELANILAGNVKSLIPGAGSLSSPRAVAPSPDSTTSEPLSACAGKSNGRVWMTLVA